MKRPMALVAFNCVFQRGQVQRARAQRAQAVRRQRAAPATGAAAGFGARALGAGVLATGGAALPAPFGRRGGCLGWRGFCARRRVPRQVRVASASVRRAWRRPAAFRVAPRRSEAAKPAAQAACGWRSQRVAAAERQRERRTSAAPSSDSSEAIKFGYHPSAIHDLTRSLRIPGSETYVSWDGVVTDSVRLGRSVRIQLPHQCCKRIQSAAHLSSHRYRWSQVIRRSRCRGAHSTCTTRGRVSLSAHRPSPGTFLFRDGSLRPRQLANYTLSV